ncbi:MAG TPA: DUF4214 domain-containing protein, partial [Acidimicrobiales bacterium]|nr:DUF4214 domain-containing protein [Acidimicrobiales bacterium]
MLAIALVAALLAVGLAAAPASAGPTRPSDPRAQEQEFFSLLNAERARAGKAPLIWNENLANDARRWSGVMAPTGGIFHTSTLGQDTARSVTDWRRAGENVGVGWSAPSLHGAFVNSPGHYANIIGDYNMLGVGVVYTESRTFVTFRFAKGTVVQTAAAAPAPSLSLSDAQATVRRLYLAYFEREPDTAGRDYWAAKLRQGYPLGQVSYEFSRSKEFLATYGSLSNGDFVRLVYRNVLDREPDAGGYTFWTSKMAAG